MWLVLMVSWIPLSPKFCPKPLELIEYFSGAARISRWAHAKGFEVRAFDSDYDKPLPGDSTFTGLQKRSVFDMNGEVGFMLLAVVSSVFFLRFETQGWASRGIFISSVPFDFLCSGWPSC